jgi:hypothetical protein
VTGKWWPALAAVAAVAVALAFAHVVSMSSGDLSIVGRQARYELRMPRIPRNRYSSTSGLRAPARRRN